jgi:hypothetical protein
MLGGKNDLVNGSNVSTAHKKDFVTSMDHHSALSPMAKEQYHRSISRFLYGYLRL